MEVTAWRMGDHYPRRQPPCQFLARKQKQRCVHVQKNFARPSQKTTNLYNPFHFLVLSETYLYYFSKCILTISKNYIAFKTPYM